MATNQIQAGINFVAQAMDADAIARILLVEGQPAPDASSEMLSLGDVFLATTEGSRFDACATLTALYDIPKSTRSVSISVDIEGAIARDGSVTIDAIRSDFHPRERIEDDYSRLDRMTR
ncbi:hypothetical protein [uncultured Salinicola sp.]|uniref:hypothetical protein n=1 Tax=uncultured Salinicola sp. TaxID=1193542 RepID=UPI0026153A18|nr:hypothetical protein [uncultured Salinicola sp.]|tara:strand:+ start:756 stop:1112 length:357 start_codon:yes stop_codon:yes gene_type:complete